MQQVVKTWWRRSTLEVTSTNLEDLLEVTSTSLEVTSTRTNTLVSTRTLLCLQALQQPDQEAGFFIMFRESFQTDANLTQGVGLRELLQIQDLQTMRRSSDISVEDR